MDMSHEVDRRLTADDDSSRFSIALVMRLAVELGDEEIVGPTHDGFRRNYPIVGGRFWGPGLRGRVIPGGADISLERTDDVTLVSALYRIVTDDGHVIVVDNRGIWRAAGAGDNHEGEAFYLRTTPRFLAPSGKYDWLNRSIFVGTVDDLSDTCVLVSCYRLHGI